MKFDKFYEVMMGRVARVCVSDVEGNVIASWRMKLGDYIHDDGSYNIYGEDDGGMISIDDTAEIIQQEDEGYECSSRGMAVEFLI